MYESKYPEHNKMIEINDQSQEIGLFLEWLFSEGRTLCEWHDELEGWGDVEPEGYYPIRKDINHLLAEFFNIDLDKIAKEKDQMLKDIRARIVE